MIYNGGMKPDPASRPPLDRSLLIWAICLGAATLLVYLRTWRFEMLYWDDDVNVLQNPLVLLPAAEGLKRIFTSIFSTDYYPLTYLSLALDQVLWGGRFVGYHVTQTLLHSANVVLVAVLVWRWTGARTAAVLAAAWFAWHPVQVETVAWIAERKNVLGTCLFLLSWLAYLRADGPPPSPRWRLAALLLFVLAVLSHALVIVMPALLIVYEIAVRRQPWREAARRTWLFFVPAAFAAVMRLLGHEQSGQLAPTFPDAYTAVLTMTKVLGQYLVTLVWPARLSNHYVVQGVTSLADSGPWITAAWIALWGLLAWRNAPRRRWALFAAAWMLVALAPVLQLVPHPTLRADRYLYVAALGPMIWIALLGQDLRRPVLPILLGAGSAIALMGATLTRIPDWRDGQTLWSDCVAKNPTSAIGHFSLAGWCIAEHRLPDAERHLRESVRYQPDFPEAEERLGAVLLLEGHTEDARSHLKRALALNPRLIQARQHLALLPTNAKP